MKVRFALQNPWNSLPNRVKLKAKYKILLKVKPKVFCRIYISKSIANKMAKNSQFVKWCKRQGNKSSLKCYTQWWALSSLFPLRNKSGNTAQSSGEAYKARKRSGSTGKEKKYRIKNVNMLLYTYIFLLHLE